MKRQLVIALGLLMSVLGSAGFIAAYASGGSRLGEGCAIALAAAGLSAAALGWAFWIVPDEVVVDEIETYPSSPEERAAESSEVAEDVREISRPRLLLGLVGVAVASFVAALVVPFRSLGTAPDGTLFHTRWRSGSRIVHEDGTPVALDDLNVDSATTVFPEGAVGDAQSQAMLIRLPEDLAATTDGYVVYSKVCTHAGCPVALYRAQDRELICPCHQSAFDVLREGAVLSGPADHALPRLPIEVAPDGTLRATGDFPVPVGPGFWERG
jgi:ubiquinol-cytochrome c reductase iron-sulfur subunit